MISVNGDRMRGTHEEMVPMLKAAHKGEQLTVVDVIVPFCV